MGLRWGSVVFGLTWAVACGDGEEGAEGQVDGSPGAVVDGGGIDAATSGDSGPRPADAATADAAGADAAGTIDAAVADAGAGDAGSAGPLIASVAVDGEFTQVHQGAQFAIVVAGSGLEAVTDITVADAFVVDPGALIVTPTRVEALMELDHGAPPGWRDVTVVGATGTATAPAFEVTPWVFAPDAMPGGRGTFQSPMLIGDYPDDQAYSGDVILFLAGEHQVERQPFFGPGVSIVGEGSAATVVRVASSAFAGLFITPDGRTTMTAIRDLTFTADSDSPSVFWDGDGTLDVDRVVFERGGLSLSGSPEAAAVVNIDDFVYRSGGGGTGILMGRGGGLSIARSEFTTCDTGVLVDARTLEITSTTFEGCTTGLRTRPSPEPFAPRAEVAVTDSLFIDNDTAILANHVNLAVTDTSISDNEATTAPSRFGIAIGSGIVTATNVTITGQDRTAVDAYSGDSDAFLVVEAFGVEIDGGQTGISVAGAADAGGLVMRSSVVRGATSAGVYVSVDDLNLIDLTGGNELSVVSGFALVDARTDNFRDVVIEAAGIRLNGNSYSGLVQGPASVPPDFRIDDDSGVIRF